jgi:predicted peptidase
MQTQHRVRFGRGDVMFTIKPILAVFALLAFIGLGDCALAQSESLETGKILVRSYDFKEAGKPMEYALYVPTKYEPKKKTPLVVLLHGLGSNPKQIMSYEGLVDQAEKHRFIVIAPFGYNTGGWYGAQGQGKQFKVGRVAPDAPDNLGELSEKDVFKVLDIARRDFNIDPHRIYLMGHSMGGGGTLYLAIKYPDIWAALAPMAPAIYSSPDDLVKIRRMPIIVVQGDKDTLVPVDSTRKWVAKMDELKMKHKYIEIAGGNHFDTITKNPKMIAEVFDFLDKQRKK